MTKSLKIFLAGLAFISVSLSLAIVFDFNPFTEKKIQPRSTLPQVPAPLPTSKELFELKSTVIDPPQDIVFTSPADTGYFNNVNFMWFGEDKNVFMLFYLEPEAEIRSIFKGEILDIDHFKKSDPEFLPQPGEESDYSQIWIEDESKNFKAYYILIGDVLVEKGAVIEAGDVLAKAKEGELTSKKGASLSLAIFDKDGNVISISKDIF